MIWAGEKIDRELKDFLAKRVAIAGKHVASYIRIRLGVQGSVVPFVASTQEEYPYRWGPELQDSVQYLPGEHPLQAVILSDAVDSHLNVGHHFSGEEEFGHWWDGWAYDFATGKIVKVAPPHEVAPRSFLRRGMWESISEVVSIISGGG